MWFQALYLLDTMVNCIWQNYGNDGPEKTQTKKHFLSGLIISNVLDQDIQKLD